MSRLVLVRHAEPAEDARGRCYGSLDVELSSAGRRHAAELAKQFRGAAFDAVYTSPRVRARDTAAAIAAELGVRVIAEDDFRELDFGELEGRTYDEIAAAQPELFRAWMTRPTTVTFPGGESYALLKERAASAVERLRSTHDAVVVVTHGGVIRAALAEWLSVPDEAIFRIDQSYCGLTVVEWLEDVPLIRVVNACRLVA